jgi:hypothetical protein
MGGEGDAMNMHLHCKDFTMKFGTKNFSSSLFLIAVLPFSDLQSKDSSI